MLFLKLYMMLLFCIRSPRGQRLPREVAHRSYSTASGSERHHQVVDEIQPAGNSYSSAPIRVNGDSLLMRKTTEDSAREAVAPGLLGALSAGRPSKNAGISAMTIDSLGMLQDTAQARWGSRHGRNLLRRASPRSHAIDMSERSPYDSSLVQLTGSSHSSAPDTIGQRESVLDRGSDPSGLDFEREAVAHRFPVSAAVEMPWRRTHAYASEMAIDSAGTLQAMNGSVTDLDGLGSSSFDESGKQSNGLWPIWPKRERKRKRGGRKKATPPPPPLPVNCEWREWDDWGQCDASCGGGSYIRKRGIFRDAYWGGNECSGPAEETASCNSNACPVPTTTTASVAPPKTEDTGKNDNKKHVVIYAAIGGGVLLLCGAGTFMYQHKQQQAQMRATLQGEQSNPRGSTAGWGDENDWNTPQ